LLLLGSVAVGVGTTGCDKANLYSTRDEVRIGQAASREMERRYRGDSTSADARRVRRIGERLLLHSDRREGVPYSFKIIEAKDINAVSLPGGPVYVYRGLLDLLGDDDDALAGVIGHEIGHVNARHAAKQMSNQELTNLGIQLILKGQTAQSVAAVLSDLLSLHYSRDDECGPSRSVVCL
jgi:predicted Zn-dependent protease